MDKSEALLIAYALENDLEDYAGQSLPRISQDIADSAADELRRLHEANEAFGQRQEWWNEKMFTLEQQRDALLEALKDATKTIEHLGYPLAAIERARAAIKAVEENT